jgi:hypothetical protein
MKREKIYEFAIDRPLTQARRNTVEKQIEANAHLSPKPISYHWDEEDDEVLHIEAEPLVIEVIFKGKTVELFATAPLWARLLFTKQRKSELKEQIEAVLQKAKFMIARKPKPQKSKFAATKKPNLKKAKSVATKKSGT